MGHTQEMHSYICNLLRLSTILIRAVNVQSLNMSYNSFSGALSKLFLNENITLTSSKLDLKGNKLTGPIPRELFQLNSLFYLDLSYNPLNCPLPVLNFTNFRLSNLGFRGSGLMGNIPKELFEFLPNLFVIDLSNNNLNGSIPSASSLKSTSSIYLNNNNLQGEIPDVLYNHYFHFQDLYLFSNNLTGVIKPFLNYPYNLDLSNNNFHGEIPSEYFSSTGALGTLHVSFLCFQIT